MYQKPHFLEKQKFSQSFSCGDPQSVFPLNKDFAMQKSFLVKSQNTIPFPEFTYEKVYMLDVGAGFPKNLQRWEDTVEAMLSTVSIPKRSKVFLTVDQVHVKKGLPQRRPGIHVDGTWSPTAAGHKIPGHKIPGHIFQEPLLGNQALILATNFFGSVAYEGEFAGCPGVGGDCSHIDLSSTVKVDLEPNYAWAGDTNTLLHESVPVPEDCFRTLVRLNVDDCSYFK